MALYIQVPRDLSRVKSKILFGLTGRQLICFSIAAAVGIPSYFLIRRTGNNSLAALGMILIMLPLFFLAMYEKNGQPPETIIRNMIQYAFVRPKIRPYKTNNYYSALERSAAAQKEVNRIAAGAIRREENKKKTAPSGKSEPQ